MRRKRDINPWIVNTGSGILTIIGIRLIDIFVGTKILTSIWVAIITAFSIIRDFFNRRIEISLWLLILLTLLVLGIILIVQRLMSNIQKGNLETDSPHIPYLNYTQEIFEGVIYRWEYEKNYSGKYQIANISMFCPDCKCSIVSYGCPVCKKYYGRVSKKNDEIGALIRHQIENKNQYGY